jgi:hypothetical protein
VFGWFTKQTPSSAAAAKPAPAAPAGRRLLTLLLPDGVGPAGIGAQLAAAGLDRMGFTADAAAIRRGRLTLVAEAVNEPWPEAGLNRLHAPGLASLGSASLTLSAALDPAVDPWSAEGALRAATLVAAGLLRSGAALGVVVHPAVEVLHDATGWLARAGNPTDPRSRPIAAWIDLARDESALTVSGLEAMGLPAVSVALSPEPAADEHERAHEAVLYAAKTMAEQNRPLREGEVLRVPLGVAIGAMPLRSRNPELDAATSVAYQVQDHGGMLLLDPLEAAPSPASLWDEARASGRPISYLAYRHLLLSGLRRQGWVEVATLSADAPGATPTHEVVVFALPQGGFVTTTCGIGRVAQPKGRADEGSANVELTLPLSGHHPAIAQTLSVMARAFHGRGPDAPAIGAGQRVTFAHPVPPLQVEVVVMGALGVVQPPAGPPIALLAPVIMTREEAASVPEGSIGAWIEREGSSPEVAGRWLERASAGQA